METRPALVERNLCARAPNSQRRARIESNHFNCALERRTAKLVVESDRLETHHQRRLIGNSFHSFHGAGEIIANDGARHRPRRGAAAADDDDDRALMILFVKGQRGSLEWPAASFGARPAC